MTLLKKWTVAELLTLDEMGRLNPENRYELLDGKVYEMPLIDEDHANEGDALVKLFVLKFSERARVRGQNPVYLEQFDLPQPDIALLERTRDYSKQHPPAQDVFLGVEVSDLTLNYVRNTKLIAIPS
jgi:Uma2 family endonuclease